MVTFDAWCISRVWGGGRGGGFACQALGFSVMPGDGKERSGSAHDAGFSVRDLQ